MIPKFKPEDQIRAVVDYKAGKGSQDAIAAKFGTVRSSLQRWIKTYDIFGEEAFFTNKKNHYSTKLKEQAVQAYLAGEGSYAAICAKYKIRSKCQLRQLVISYNSHEEPKGSKTGGNTVMAGRTTTLNERIEIVKYCIDHNHNYKETSEKFRISYQQARNYTIKYEANGIDALQDKRGRRKPEEELTEIEKLRAELKLEKALRQKAEMEVSFLKKLEELERRRG